MGTPYNENGETIIPLVPKESNGKMHVLPQRWEREWKFYVHQTGDKAEAQEQAKQRGWAICLSGQNENGEDLFSWKSMTTARYLAQACPMPDLSYINGLEKELKQKKNKLYNDLLLGKPHGINGGTFGLLGYFNPWGSPHGGETGGPEIWQWAGMEMIESGETDGLLWARAANRSYIDRQPGAIYLTNGRPIDLDKHLDLQGRAPWDLFNGEFFKGKDSPWNFDTVDTSQVDFVKQNNLKPNYESNLKKHDSVDYQHYGRRLWPLKILCWLDNDPAAKMRLEMLSELGRMTYLTGPKEELDDNIQFAKQFPNIGS
jgi:hypothetical protein